MTIGSRRVRLECFSLFTTRVVNHSRFLRTTAEHISRGMLEERIGQAASDLTTPIVVYCPRGCLGALAADSLQKMGYQNVYSLKGGLQHWFEAGGMVECAAARRKANPQVSLSTSIQTLLAGYTGAPELILAAKSHAS